jgi:ATP-binding cassette subfamily B protein
VSTTTRPLPSLGDLTSSRQQSVETDGPCKIEADRLNFFYGEKRALEDISIKIKPNLVTAFIGPSGCGKSTFLRTLNRMNDIIVGTRVEGEVLIEGRDIYAPGVDVVELRRRVGMVLQDPFLFTGTVEQNIRLGSDWIENEAIERAAEEVNVADFIRTLPNGFREPMRERGSNLSTGQKQLISFARALAHNPSILVLDEATSSVDTETEFRVRDALSRMIGAQGRTSIVVAHRLSTVQRADKIVVMHKGRVREIGTHQQLLSQRGIYWKLYQLQYKDQEVGAPPSDSGSAHQPVGADD